MNVLKSQRWAITWALFILVLCNLPLPQHEGEGGFFFKGFDKLAHTGLFFVLTVLLFYGKVRAQRNDHFRIQTLIKIIAVSALLGGAVEFLQWWIFTFRSAEWWDFTCDLTGTFMGIFAYLAFYIANHHEQKI